MKKLNIMIATVALVALFFISCTKKDVAKEKVVYETDFSFDDGNWYTGEIKPGISATIADGYYNFVTATNGGRNSFTKTWFQSSTGKGMAVETSVKSFKVDVPGTDNTWGYSSLLFGRKDDNNAFYLSIVADRYMIFAYLNSSSYTILKDWTTDAVVNANQFNRLRVELKNGQLNYLINGKLVYTMQSPISTLDLFGFHVAPYSAMQADYIKAVELLD